MFYYRDTMHQRALRVMAPKLSAATVIGENVSEEHLAAMSSCEDMTTQLARELVSGLKENADELAESFRKWQSTETGMRNRTAAKGGTQTFSAADRKTEAGA